jgi:hypothetical protein
LGVRDWFKKRGQKKKAKESAPEPEKPREPVAEGTEELAPEPPTQEAEEPTPTPVAEETEKLAPEPSSEKIEEPTTEPATEEKEEVAPETPTQEPEKPAPEPSAEDAEERVPETPAEEIGELSPEAGPEETKEVVPEQLTQAEGPTPELAAEGTEELAPEPPTQEAEEPSPEPVDREKEELPPEQPPSEKAEKPIPSPWKLAFRGAGKKRKQKEKDEKKERKEKPEKKAKKEKESAPEPAFLKLLILPTTLASMLLGLSIMPLFPQPLPAILAFLIAFLAYKKPIIGMPIGGLAIGLGLMYNLSKMNFIAMLGEPAVRSAFVFVLLFLFTALPIIFHSRRAVISINLGIIAAILLFFSQTYFLAIPLIFTAVVIFKKISFLTVIYYGLISVPLQIMQYLNLVMPIDRWDWWVEPGTSTPLYVPLTEIFTDIQESMLQFRLYDTSKVVYAITDQITLDPPAMPHTALEMISHYFDSLPGILLFLFMVLGIVSVFVFFTRTFFAKSNISYGERFLPIMSATIGVVLFFLLAVSLQGALAFRVDVNGVQIAIATFATVMFTLPTLMIDYTPKRRATVDMIMEKAKELKAKLQIFEDELYEVKSSLPIASGPFEVKTLMVRDRLNDVLSKASMRLDEAAEIEKIFNELDSLSHEIESLAAELIVSVGEYQIFVNCEFSKWLGTFKDIGVETEIAAKTAFQPEAPLGTRIDQIKEVIAEGRSFANEVIKVAEQAYSVIRSFYDSGLPEESQSIAFAQKKLDEKATPWVALDALFNALTNWNKQYKVQISKSVGPLQSMLTTIANLSTQNGRLQQVLGDDFSRMMENSQKAKTIKMDIEKRTLSVINLLTVKDVFHSSLGIARDVLSILYEKLKSKEKAIELILPSEDFLWEKNDALMKRMASAMEVTSESSNVTLSEVLEKLPKLLSYVEECVETIALYNNMEELLLNYPIAEMAVDNLFREKKSISAKDLPFAPKYAEEYLKLFYSQKFREFSFDRATMLLTKKT